ncbi:EAL and HDOD domain-containing protein [Sulfuriferula thiophila]|uniref:EAL and HDOD domain-containing protein n=1 Tax=Sulfuriferula thiophila TaxID=1781211 RepID=UPI000F614C0A|nr:HDOD domain-containing protein [Sulfuriferula thiophila]
MFDKYFKFLKSKDVEPVAEKPPVPVPAPPSIDQLVPLIKPRAAAAADQPLSINTQDVAQDQVVTDALDIATHGERNNSIEMLKRFLGRQPVLNSSQHIIGYEFSLRNNIDTALTPTIQQMRDEMLVASMIDLDIKPILGNKMAFISMAPPMLSSDWLAMLPGQNMVLAIDSTQITDLPATIAQCQARIAEGFSIALDNPVNATELAPLLSLAKYVRFEVHQFNAFELSKHVIAALKLSSAMLVATQVETEDDFNACLAMSFNCFQGYYFTQRQPNAPHRIDNNRVRVIELLNMVIAQAEIPALETVLKRDAVLSYKLLSFINSAANGLSRKLDSISQALILLGYNQFYRWLTLLLFNSSSQDARSQILLQNALIRARLAETLGKDQLSAADRDGLFIAGIFSLLDALLNLPMEQAVAKLNLSDNLTQALLHNQGVYAPYLQLAIACEKGNQSQINALAASANLSVDAVNLAHVKALIWAEEFAS